MKQVETINPFLQRAHWLVGESSACRSQFILTCENRLSASCLSSALDKAVTGAWHALTRSFGTLETGSHYQSECSPPGEQTVAQWVTHHWWGETMNPRGNSTQYVLSSGTGGQECCEQRAPILHNVSKMALLKMCFALFVLFHYVVG